jgi:hypothetical protein
MVYHTLVILLHRPFVETAASPDTSVVSTCWSRCEEAARNTTALLKRYRAAFSLARAPYLIVRDLRRFVADFSPTRLLWQRLYTSELQPNVRLTPKRINFFKHVLKGWGKIPQRIQE